MNVIIVTACPSGVATTFLAARGLERAAARRGWKATVEMHSQLQPLVPADAATLAAAELVVIATSAPVELTRFVGKRVYQGSIAQALPDPDAFLTLAEGQATKLTVATRLAASAPVAPAPTPVATGGKKLVAVTACPTGVAHTFMAAEALQQAAKRLGYDLQVETQGSVGARNPLSADAIADADVVLLAADIEVATERFAGKKIYRCGTGIALKQAGSDAEQGAGRRQAGNGGHRRQGGRPSKRRPASINTC